MKNIIGTVLIVIGLAVMAWLGWVVLNSNPRSIVNQPSKYQITLECEKLSAIATNKEWSYQNCLKNLDGVLSDIKKITI
jgi:hypothetical protein